MKSEYIHEIRALDLFRSMSNAAFEALVQAAYLQNFPAQLDLIREGDPADFLYIVLDGSVELYAEAENGRSATMGILRPISTFILAAVLKDAVYLMSARTCEKAKLLLIPAENVRQVFETDGDFARAIIHELAHCYRGMVKEHKDLKLRSAVERLANRLLRYHEEQGSKGVLELPHDKRRLASILAMTPENLSRALNTLKPYGVDVDGPLIHLTDLQALERLAKPNPLIDDQNT